MKVFENVIKSAACRVNKEFLCVKRDHKRFRRAFRGTACVKLEENNVQSPSVKGKPLSEIPGPSALPLVGTGWLYSSLGPYSTKSKNIEAREDLLKKYGTIYKEKLGGKWIVSIHDVKDIELVIRSQGRSPIRVQTESVVKFRKSRPDIYSTVGLVEEAGEKWENMRRMVSNEVLKLENARSYIELLSPIADRFCENIKKLRDSRSGEVEDVRDMLFRYGLEAMWVSTLGKTLGAMEDPPSEEARYIINNALGFFRTISALTLAPPYMKYFPTKLYKEQCMYDENLHRMIVKHTKQVREDFDRMPSDYIHKNTIFNKFYQMKDFDVNDINVVIVDFIIAGIPTTSFFLSIFLHRLAKEPHLIERLREEALRVVSSDGLVTKENLQNLHLLRATINEGFRICSIIPSLLKILPVDVVLQGYYLPPGTLIFCQTRVSGRDCGNFTDPLKIIPERWMPSTEEIKKRYPNHEKLSTELKSNRFLVLPFGFGPRSCVGRRLAEQEIMVIMTKILLNFDLQSEGELELGDQLVIAPADKVKITFSDI